MFRVIRQAIRGCTDLPYVGPHPGCDIMIMFIIMGAIAGAKGGISGVIGGSCIVAIGVLPFFLYGAYDRANLSDTLVKKHADEQAN